MPIDSSSACKFCACENLEEFAAQERMLGLGGEFIYQECTNCGSLQLKEIPADLSKFYPKEYYSFNPLVQSGPFKRVLKRLRMALLRNGFPIQILPYGPWLKKVRPALQDRIADIGCGNGQLLYELYSGGFKNLEGFDPFIRSDQQLANGLQLWKNELSEASGSFDWIMMHHAFEHMVNPEEVLRTCREKLKPGGKLLIRTPISDAAIFREEKEFWVQLDAPRHLVICSLNGFRLLAEKVGLELEETVFDSEAFQFMGTELYKRNLPLTYENLEHEFDSSEQELYTKKALQYNLEGLGDQVCFYLSRKD